MYSEGGYRTQTEKKRILHCVTSTSAREVDEGVTDTEERKVPEITEKEERK